MHVLDLPSLQQQQFREHKSVRQYIASMRELLDLKPSELSEDPAGQTSLKNWQNQMETQLGQLQTVLRDHFTAEERSPMYEAGEPYFLRFSRELDSLVKEHDLMLGQIQNFLPRIHAMHDGSLSDQIQAFLTLLSRHEQEENKILQKAFGEDLGDGD